MSDDDKPFACTTQGCGMRFTNEDHLTVHMKKHDMSLALNTGSTLSPNHLFLDQTPTPTKFLRNCEEIGLFQELNKNPFEEAFKKASDVEGQPDSHILSSSKDVRISPLCGSRTPTQTSGVPLPGPHSNSRSLDTPSSTHFAKTANHDDLATPQTTVSEDGPAEGKSSPNIPSSQSAASQANQPTSTTSDDEVVIISKTQAADSSTPTTKTPPVTAETTNPVLISMEPPTSISPSLQPSSVNPPVVTSPQYTMQVLLQLPTGQTVPVQIPAALSTQAVQVTSIPITPATQVLASKTSTAPSSTSQQPSLAKQKLKAALQQSAQNSKLITSSSPSHTVSPPSTASVVGGASTVKTVIPSGLHGLPVAASASGSAVSSTPHSTSFNNCLEDSSDGSYMEMEGVGSPDSLESVSIGGIKRKREDGDPEDRRRKFLERNRAAAARCRQRRKQWITNLEKKAEELQNTNNRLQSEVNSLRNEVAQLKTLLLAHKDCPITLQQKSQGQLSIQTISMPVVDGMLIDTGDVATAEAIATSALTNMAQRGVIVEATETDEGLEIITLSPKVHIKKET